MVNKFWFGALLVVISGCSSDATEPSGDESGGSSGTGAVGGTGGAAAGAGGAGAVSSVGGSAGTTGTTGGAPGTAGTAGSSSVGGAGGLGGTPGVGGTAGLDGSSAGTGGAPEGGSGGMSGGDGKPAPRPSMGCGNANPPTGTAGQPRTVSGHQYYVKLPTNYDPSKPYPTLIMFNPTNNPIDWAEKNAGFEGTGPRENWIRVYPHMQNPGSGWGSGDVPFFEPFYNEITATYCIDLERVFVGGESSGGDFVSILGCEHGDKLAATMPCATKPVNGYSLNVPTSRQCKGNPIAFVLHGKNDTVVGTENGPKTRDFYKHINNCGDDTVPVQGYDSAPANCVMYQGCDAPVYWCNHTDPNYSNTNHGWPAFAPKLLWEKMSEY